MIDEKKLIEERPEYLNPCHESHGEYNKGWNACNDMWFDLVHEQPKVDECNKDCKDCWKTKLVNESQWIPFPEPYRGE